MINNLIMKKIPLSYLNLINGGGDGGDTSIDFTKTPGGSVGITPSFPVGPNISAGPTVYVNPASGDINGGGASFSISWG